MLHNALRGTLLKVKSPNTRAVVDDLETAKRFDYIEDNKFHKTLKDLHMIVEDDMNEGNLLNYYYSESKRNFLYVLPIVTRQCNFRCTYCYQKHENKVMNSEVYENLLLAIENEVERKGYKTVLMSFFGGEPLLEYESICNFMEKAQVLAEAKSVKVNGWMTTNAYLLSFDRFSRLVELGVTHYQITVDGLKEPHDKNRFLVNGVGTWDSILKNLQDAKSSALDFKIVLRTNFDAHLATDFENYLKFMSEIVSDDSRFVFTFGAVKNLGVLPENDLVEQAEESDVTKQMSVFAKNLNLGILEQAWAPLSGMCYAALANSFVIDTDGSLLKCTTMIDDCENCVGKLTEKGFEVNDEKICKWVSYDLPAECEDCPILPLCYGRKCPPVVWRKKMNDPDYCKNQVKFYEGYMKIAFLDG